MLYLTNKLEQPWTTLAINVCSYNNIAFHFQLIISFAIHYSKQKVLAMKYPKKIAVLKLYASLCVIFIS